MNKKDWTIERLRKSQGEKLKKLVLDKAPPEAILKYLMKWFSYTGIERQTKVSVRNLKRVRFSTNDPLTPQKKGAISKSLRNFSSRVYEGLLLGEKPTFLITDS